MGVLSRSAIEQYLARGELRIMPWMEQRDPARNDNTIDVRLGLEFITMKKGNLCALTFDVNTTTESARDLRRFYDRVYVGLGQPFILHPREFVLGGTFEYLKLPNSLFAEVVGKSSWGRLGLIIATATAVHPGYKGCLTLELVNHGNIPIELYPATPIAQIVFYHVEGEQEAYRGLYSGFCGPTRPECSGIHHDSNEIWDWLPR